MYHVLFSRTFVGSAANAETRRHPKAAALMDSSLGLGAGSSTAGKFSKKKGPERDPTLENYPAANPVMMSGRAAQSNIT